MLRTTSLLRSLDVHTSATFLYDIQEVSKIEVISRVERVTPQALNAV
jgi:hypothetical protein